MQGPSRTEDLCWPSSGCRVRGPLYPLAVMQKIAMEKNLMKFLSFGAGIVLLSAALDVQAANYCGELTNATGPFDYRQKSENEETLKIVEGRHFTQNYERLIADERGYLGGEFDYTLRAFPNHHRALMALSKLVLRDKNPRPSGTHYSVECYFDRAMRFRPDDGMVHLVYGIYLSQSGNVEKAITEIDTADRLQPENANINYNLGLLYFKKKNYDQARIHARKAYQLGFALPGLKNMLIGAGKWGGPSEN